MSDVVRVAVLGYGYWGPNIVRTLRDLPGAELAVCVDTVPARLRAAHERFQTPVTDHWRDAVDDWSIDAVILATPARTHRDLTLECLARRKHVLVEKPFATSAADVRAMYEAADARALVLEPGHIFLHSPAVQALRHEVERGALGEPRTAFAVRVSHGPRVRTDVDVTFDCMVHDLYILHDLFGPAREVSAAGVASLTPNVADGASAQVRFANDARAFCYASWCEPEKVRRMTLVGSRAMAVYDDLVPDEPVRLFERGYRPIEGVDAFGNEGLERYDQGARAVPVSADEPLRRQLGAFLERIRKGGAPLVSPASVLAVTETLEAIGRSMRRGGAPEPVTGGTR